MNRKKIIIGIVIVLTANIVGWVLVSVSHTAEQRAFDRWVAAVDQKATNITVKQSPAEKQFADPSIIPSKEMEYVYYERVLIAELRRRSDVHFNLQIFNLFAILAVVSKRLRLIPKSTVLSPLIAS